MNEPSAAYLLTLAVSATLSRIQFEIIDSPFH